MIININLASIKCNIMTWHIFSWKYCYLLICHIVLNGPMTSAQILLYEKNLQRNSQIMVQAIFKNKYKRKSRTVWARGTGLDQRCAQDLAGPNIERFLKNMPIDTVYLLTFKLCPPPQNALPIWHMVSAGRCLAESSLASDVCAQLPHVWVTPLQLRYCATAFNAPFCSPH